MNRTKYAMTFVDPDSGEKYVVRGLNHKGLWFSLVCFNDNGILIRNVNNPTKKVFIRALCTPAVVAETTSSIGWDFNELLYDGKSFHILNPYSKERWSNGIYTVPVKVAPKVRRLLIKKINEYKTRVGGGPQIPE